MKNVIALLMIVALSACAAAPQAPVTLAPLGGAAKAGPNITATLARTGTCEMDVAADFTAMTSYRVRAARMLEAHTLTVELAVKVQALADQARADLDAACPNASARLDVARRDAARSTLKSIATLLEKKP